MRRYAPRVMFAPISALAGVGVDVLVFPAASRPSINRRISLLPKILARERESAAPMVDVLCCFAVRCARGGRVGAGGKCALRKCGLVCSFLAKTDVQCRSRQCPQWDALVYSNLQGSMGPVQEEYVDFWSGTWIFWGCFRNALRGKG